MWWAARLHRVADYASDPSSPHGMGVACLADLLANGLNSARCLAFLHGKYRIRTESCLRRFLFPERNFAAREAPSWRLLSRRGQ